MTEGFRDIDQVGHRIDAEDKADVARIIPTVQFACLRKVGVASKQDRLESGTSSHRRCLIKTLGRAFIGRPIAVAIIQNKGSPVVASDTTKGW